MLKVLKDDVSQRSDIYAAYAAGTLAPSFRLLVETQAAIRSDVRDRVNHAEAISGIFLEQERPTMLAPNAFERTLQALDDLEEEADAKDAAKLASERLSELLDLPEPLRERALESCMRGGWKRMTSGVKRLEIGTQAGGHAHLYRIEPGATVPTHSHFDDELTLVVQGGFSDETGSYGPGDICLKTPTDTHSPVGDDDGICLALAVSEGGMEFKGMLGILQKVFTRRPN
ncbi:MAG: ChrR family anti-sigma-E factor [Henriciella sp.]|nr:ChrR family anti-sigma-E factor [Henriciella sp.]